MTLKDILIRLSPFLIGLLLIGWLAKLLGLLREGADQLNRFKMSYIGYLFPWLQNIRSFPRSIVIFFFLKWDENAPRLQKYDQIMNWTSFWKILQKIIRRR